MVNKDNSSDFSSHHIEGFAKQGGYFKVPLFSHIVDNLWVGGCPRESLPNNFKAVVCLYPWEPYKVSEEIIYVRAYLYDANDLPNTKQIRALAETVNAFRKSGQVLVHCQAGLNRSNLVAAMALMLDGMSAQAAIQLLRKKRCNMVLCNSLFENWLLTQGV